jgi:cysteine-rich repeat protein
MLERCLHCSGFVPPTLDICPHCDRKQSWLTTGKRLVSCGLVAVTLMACYGDISKYKDDAGYDNSDFDNNFTEEACRSSSLEVVNEQIVHANNAVTFNESKGSCVGDQGREVVTIYKSDGAAPTPNVPGTLHVHWEGDTNLGVYVRQGCSNASSELACQPASKEGNLDVHVNNPNNLAIFFDGKTRNDKGDFQYTITFSPDCGNGKIDANESCDDGNAFAGDGCNSVCEIEYESICTAALPANLGANSGDTTIGSRAFNSVCTQGNGKEQLYVYESTSEQPGVLSADLNSMADLGLFSFRTSCTNPSDVICSNDNFANGTEHLDIPIGPKERVWIAVDGSNDQEQGPFALKLSFTPTCGNKQLDPSETCDDGNIVDGDGCSAACQIENEFYCQLATPLQQGDNTGSTEGQPDVFQVLGTKSPESLFQYMPEQDGVLSIILDADTNMGFVAYDGCFDTVLAKASQQPAGILEAAVVPVSAKQPVFLLVEGITASDSGSFQLKLQFTPQN